MNKPLVAVLVVVLAALVVYLAMRQPPDTRPPIADTPPKDVPTIPGEDLGGVPADGPGDFQVAVVAKKVGAQSRLEFTVTEANGWGAQGVYIRFWHLVQNEETGEWEQDDRMDPVEVLPGEPLRFGEPLVYETTLTGVELGQLGGELGTTEEWAAEISKPIDLRKPE